MRKIGRRFDEARHVVILDLVGMFVEEDDLQQIYDACTAESKGGHPFCLINLLEVTEIRGRGVAQLVRCAATMRQKGSLVKFCLADQHIRAKFNQRHIPDLFGFFEEERVALASFDTPLPPAA